MISLCYHGDRGKWAVDHDELGEVFACDAYADAALFAAKLKLYESRLTTAGPLLLEAKAALAKESEKVGLLQHCNANLSAILVAAGAPEFNSPFAAQRWAESIIELRNLAERVLRFGLTGGECFSATRGVEAKDLRAVLDRLGRPA